MIALYLTNPVDPGVAASGLMTTVTGIGGTRVILNMRHLLLSPSTNHIDVPGIETLPVATPGRSGAYHYKFCCNTKAMVTANLQRLRLDRCKGWAYD